MDGTTCLSCAGEKATPREYGSLFSSTLYEVSLPNRPIHDHANSDCFMKILEGSLQEVQYTSPETGNQPLTYLRTQDIDKNEVTHINGVHVSFPSR